MKKVKKGKFWPIVLAVICLLGILVVVRGAMLNVEMHEPINKKFIIILLVFLFLIFCVYSSLNFSLSYDETHFEYAKGKSSEPVCVNFSDIDVIQHYSYRAGKRSTNEYKVFLKETDAEVVLPYRQIDNKESYIEFFEQIRKVNPGVRFTKLHSGLLGNKEEEIPFEQFI